MFDSAFLARQPIVDRNQEIVGYELLYRGDAAAESADVRSDLQAGANVLINTLSNIGTDWLLGNKLAFINVAQQLLESGFLELLDLVEGKIVLEIQSNLINDDYAAGKLPELRAHGYGVALDADALRPEHIALLPHANYLKLDVRQLGLERLAQLLPKVRQKLKVKLVAEKVETPAEFKACHDMGFDYFQGYFFAKPETMVTRVINPGYASIVELLNLVRKDPEIHEVETALKRDPALSFKLLRYINSAGFGLSCEIQSFRHAVTILGYEKLYKWLTLLMITANKDQAPPVLLRTAITRGRLVELLGQKFLSGTDRDNLFVVGVFSLLDAMLDMPMDAVLEKLQLPEQVQEALLTRQGLYGPFLQLAEYCERGDNDEMEMLAMSLQMNPETVNKAHLDALAWSESLGL